MTPEEIRLSAEAALRVARAHRLALITGAVTASAYLSGFALLTFVPELPGWGWVLVVAGGVGLAAFAIWMWRWRSRSEPLLRVVARRMLISSVFSLVAIPVFWVLAVLPRI